jgi:ABC-2 type transport system permease protein
VSRPNAFVIFLREIRFEVLRALRTRAFSLSAIGFPVMFYCLFGLLMNRNETFGNVLVAKYLLGGYAVFGALGASIFGIGVGVSLDRTAGWLELKRASPMPPLAYVLAKCVMAVVFSVIITGVLSVLGVTAGHVHMSLIEFARISCIAMIGAVPFSCLGLAIAMLVPANAAGGVGNMIYLPMSFLSGLWVPLAMLPKWLQQIAPALPSYHLAQMMYAALGATARGTLASHLGCLFGFTLIMLGLSWIGFRRGESNS